MNNRTFVYTRDGSTNTITSPTGSGLFIDNSSGNSFLLSATSEVEQEVTNKDKRGKSVTFKKKGVSVKAYFKYAKSKLSKIEKEELDKRIKKLAGLIEYSKPMGQWALYEEAAKEFSFILKEQEINIVGIDKWINRSLIVDNLHRIREGNVEFKELSEFPRIIPTEPRKVIENIKKKDLFDNFYILFIDDTGEKVESNYKKIKEKDPIVFGVFDDAPDRLYYITDWIDEYCDLTLKSLLEDSSNLEGDFKIDFVEEINSSYIDRIRKELEEKEERLKRTNMRTYRKMMEEEKNSYKTKSIWTKFVNLFKKAPSSNG